MNNSNIVSYEDLKEMSGAKTAKAVERYCIEHGIAYIRHKTRVTTTIAAINRVLGIEPLEVINDDIQV